MKNIDDEECAFRGGSWYGDAAHCRASNRNGNPPDYRSIVLGFRVLHRRRKK